MKYSVISTDDHLQEAPDTWTDRMSKKKWGDKIPGVRPNGDGTDSWFIYDQTSTLGRGVAFVDGALTDRSKFVTRWEDVPQIAYVPEERLKAMDQDGVDVHAFFGNVSGAAGHTFSDPKWTDEDFRLECIQAFNDYQIDVWADPHPGRFITLAIVPLWDVEKAVNELRRMKKRGIRGLSFAFPQQFGYPHIADRYWDPLWDVAQEANLSLNLHIGGGGSMGLNATYPPDIDPLLRMAEGSTKAISANTQVMATMLFAGIMERFPQLKVVSSESGLGWVPYLLEVADHQWDRQKLARIGMSMKPSEYFHRQCYVNFWFEVIGVEMREYIGLDNIMWEPDFPHPTCTWPNSQDYIHRGMGKLSDEERQKILVDNAVKVFNLEEFQD